VANVVTRTNWIASPPGHLAVPAEKVLIQEWRQQMSCNSPEAREITRFLKHNACIGNQRRARCRDFSIDGTHVKGSFDCRSKHNPGGFVLYDVSYRIRIDFDITAPDWQAIKICTPNIAGRELCFSVRDIAALIGIIAMESKEAEIFKKIMLEQGVVVESPVEKNGEKRSGVVQSEPVSKVVTVLYQIPKNKNMVHIVAKGEVETSGWLNPRLSMIVYTNAPSDGILEFNFIAEKPNDIVIPIVNNVFTPLTSGTLAPWVEGVRIHAANNFLEINFSVDKPKDIWPWPL
jgi:hypothetical protein